MAPEMERLRRKFPVGHAVRTGRQRKRQEAAPVALETASRTAKEEKRAEEERARMEPRCWGADRCRMERRRWRTRASLASPKQRPASVMASTVGPASAVSDDRRRRAKHQRPPPRRMTAGLQLHAWTSAWSKLQCRRRDPLPLHPKHRPQPCPHPSRRLLPQSRPRPRQQPPPVPPQLRHRHPLRPTPSRPLRPRHRRLRRAPRRPGPWSWSLPWKR